MRKPVAKPTSPKPEKPAQPAPDQTQRTPRAFAPAKAAPGPRKMEEWAEPETLNAARTPAEGKKTNWALRLMLGAGGILVSLGLGLMFERLVRDLFARYEWLGWVGSAALVLFVLAIIALLVREFGALSRLRNLDHLRQSAEKTLQGNLPEEGRAIVGRLQLLYHKRPDMARARQLLDAENSDQFDGAEMIMSAERHLMGPLDTRARALTAAAARRVAIVTAISPRALVDIAFVAYESLKLTRAIAALYGARPGLLGGWKLWSSMLSHLAVTGGVALGDSVIQQLLGHGLAARLSARLGEGLVNGLMTVRVGISAMRVTRPLPFDRLKQPLVIDFAADLAKIGQAKTGQEENSQPKTGQTGKSD